jgi:phosphoribosylformimino-5-aminoimidazole carboxamide ribotide isomerase|tara:strand:- start:957 stop:1679 length:723 start_codon:yes stop_codon:yes gene_type:complete
MIIFPAIDIKGGKCVRLFQGDFNKVTEYEASPLNQAKKLEELGFDFLHIVDLDQAADPLTKKSNFNIVKDIIKNTNLKVQLGGGLRTLKNIEEAINSGVSSVVVGTSAINDVSFLQNACNKFSNQISVSIDSKNGLIATQGWKKITQKNVADYMNEIKNIKVKSIIFTDINRDGTKKGVNLKETLNLAELTKFPVIASGGISKIDDVVEIKNTKKIRGVIIGKAIYDGSINLKELSKLRN